MMKSPSGKNEMDIFDYMKEIMIRTGKRIEVESLVPQGNVKLSYMLDGSCIKSYVIVSEILLYELRSSNEYFIIVNLVKSAVDVSCYN
jgi:hypothetical protein